MILQNARLMVDVTPAYGGRVTRLVDRRTGRDWMAPGGESPNTGEAAVYQLAEAVGWDECFPTVSAFDATGTVWGRRMRDHGDLWGRPFAVTEARDDLLALSFETSEFSFHRTLHLDGPTLVADYRVENRMTDPMPYLWALHGLLSTEAGDRIVLPGIERLSAAYVGLNGIAQPITALDLQAYDDRIGFALQDVQPHNGFAAKLYATVPPDARARVGGRNGWLEIAWDGTRIGHLGLWITYGGWPGPVFGPGSVHQIAIEPTTASTDHFGADVTGGQVASIAPGDGAEWTIRMTVSDGAT